MERSKLHIAILSSPGLGHLIPVRVLGHRLATHHNAQVTVLVVTASKSPTESQLLQAAIGVKELVDILPVYISGGVSPNSAIVKQLCDMMRESLPAIRQTISNMKHRPDVLIVDMFGTEAFPIADEFHMPKYVYNIPTAWFTALTVYCQVLEREIQGQYVDQQEPLKIPGCKSVRPEDVVDPMLDRDDPQYHEYVRLGSQYSLSDGVLINTWEDIERTSLRALMFDETLHSVVKVPVYPIGPVVRSIDPSSAKSEVMEWLDLQPADSVIYVSFGSGGTMSIEQMTELALGLELSQQRFVWVVRPPTMSGTDGSFFTTGSVSDGNPDYLPEGFLTRTQHLGKVVRLWAPQVEILSHPAVGGFFTHCGWNSILESIHGGVPMIAWPLYAEQRLNATLLTEELGLAIRTAELPTKKLVLRKEIEKMVRTLMQCKEGKAMKERAIDLRNSARKAICVGGSSFNALCELLIDCGERLKSNQSKGHQVY